MGEQAVDQRWPVPQMALWTLIIGLLLSLCCSATAVGAEMHVFNPDLSLMGNCNTPAYDAVPDPGPCPGVPGIDHPLKAFSVPTSVSADSYGNIYVASYGQNNEGKEGRIDLFDSSGFFISEVAAPVGPVNTAVDSKGNLYVIGKAGELLLYQPAAPYEPAAGKIQYENPPKTVAGTSLALFVGLAIDPLSDHVFAHYGTSITEYGSAAEGNKFIEAFGEETLKPAPHGIGLAIDAAHGKIYASNLEHAGSQPPVVRVFELKSPHALLQTINGSTTPTGQFLSSLLSLAVDEATGNLFVDDGAGGAEVVYELAPDGEYRHTISYELAGHTAYGGQIEVDNGENSPNGALNPFGRFLFVPAFPTGAGHTFAFGPPEECEPVIEASSFTGVTTSEAKLHAEIEPCNLETAYTFEYTTEQSFEEEGFAAAKVAGEGQIPAGLAPVPVAAVAKGLSPGTAYRFRVLASNELGNDEAEGEFATYLSNISFPCPNDALRAGFSMLLPDCRAYELVTPASTNARTPIGVGHLGTYFATRETSPDGNSVSFQIEGGSLSGVGTGSLAGDPYLVKREEKGWSTSYTGPTGAEAPTIQPGSNSPDQGYFFWTSDRKGSTAIEEKPTNYVRYPDGHSTLIGRGSLGSDPEATGKLISENGTHIIFSSINNPGAGHIAIQLEPDAPPDGTAAVYDRTRDEVTHVVSLLPSNVTPAAGQDAQYQGASLDGKGIAFSIGKKLYLRFNDEETYEVGEGVAFAGVAEGGARIFYVEGGDIFAFDTETEEAIRFTEAGNATPINVAAEGTVVYFVSPSVLTGEANPTGAIPQKGKENLYRSKEGAISFVGTVTKRDVEGEEPGGEVVDGLGLWIVAVGTGKSGTSSPGSFGVDPSRTTSDGSVLLFESRAALDGYDPKGHAEVYRYDSSSDTLACLSCIPTKEPASGEASLQSITQSQGAPEPFSSYAFVTNLSSGGQRAFFQSTEPLVLDDTDGLQDVYEWEAQGVGNCERFEGCISLISSGHSDRVDYLYGVSDSGDDVFFRTSDLLLPSDSDETPSIYDARVGGGFPQAAEEECLGEGCRPGITPPPSLPTPGILPGDESGNWSPPCPKGKRQVVRNGKTRCVSKHHKHSRRKAGSKKKGAGK